MIVIGTATSRRMALSIGLIALALAITILGTVVGSFVSAQWHRAAAARSLVTRYENIINRQKEASRLLVGSERRQEIARYFLNAPNPPAAAAGLQQLISGLDGFRALTIQELSASPREGKPEEITVTLSANGELRDVAQFFVELNSLSPHLFIEGLSMVQMRATDRPAQTQFSIRLFALFEKEARA